MLMNFALFGCFKEAELLLLIVTGNLHASREWVLSRWVCGMMFNYILYAKMFFRNILHFFHCKTFFGLAQKRTTLGFCGR